MAKREISREDVLRELKRIALSRPNAGIELAYMEKPTRQMIQRLDLSAVSEFKRNSAGSVELRFIDRVNAGDDGKRRHCDTPIQRLVGRVFRKIEKHR